MAEAGVGTGDSAARHGRVPSLARAAVVLQTISDAGRPMTLADLTGSTSYPKSSVMGICHALTHENFLVHGVDGTYALGSRVFELASAARAYSWPIHDIGFS
jgi:ribose transport system substrate-binding protein